MSLFLTDRQLEVLEFIRASTEGRGYPPTLREIGDRFKIRSTNGVADHLRALERKGYLVRDPMSSRGMRLTGKPVEKEDLTARLISEEQRNTVVYFVQSLETLRIKIGYTAHLAERARTLEGGRVMILTTIRGGLQTEAWAHRRFAASRVEGEWFAPSGDLVDFIASIAPLATADMRRAAAGAPEEQVGCSPHRCTICAAIGHNARTCSDGSPALEATGT